MSACPKSQVEPLKGAYELDKKINTGWTPRLTQISCVELMQNIFTIEQSVKVDNDDPIYSPLSLSHHFALWRIDIRVLELQALCR